MTRKNFAKRTIAALLAFILAFSSVNVDALSAYADDVAIEESEETLESEETFEYVEEETVEEVSTGETIQNDGDNDSTISPGLNFDDSYDAETNSFSGNWKKEITLQAFTETRHAKLAYNCSAKSYTETNLETLYVKKKVMEGTYEDSCDLEYSIDFDANNSYAIQAKDIGEYRIYTSEIDENNYVTVNVVLPYFGMYTGDGEKSIENYIPEGEVVIPNYNYSIRIEDSYGNEDICRTFLVARKEKSDEENFTDEDFIAPENDKYNSYEIGESNMIVSFFEGSTDFKYCFRVIIRNVDEDIKFDSRLNMSPVLSKEGLVMMYRRTDDEGNLTEGRKDGENTYSYYDNVFSCIGSIDDLVIFGKNPNSTLETYENDGKVMTRLDDSYRDQSAFKDGFVIEKKGEEGYSATQDMTISYDESASSWHIKSSVPGMYRISNTVLGGDHYVYITVEDGSEYGLVINDSTDSDGKFIDNSWKKETTIYLKEGDKKCLLGFNNAGSIGNGKSVNQIWFDMIGDENDAEEGVIKPTYLKKVDEFTIERYDDNSDKWVKYEDLSQTSDLEIWYEYAYQYFDLKANRVGTYRIRDAERGGNNYLTVKVCYPATGFYSTDVTNMAESIDNYINEDAFVKPGVTKTIFTHLNPDSYNSETTQATEYFAIKENGSDETKYLSKDSLKDGAIYDVSGCEVKLTDNGNFAFELDGSRTDFQICYKVVFKDGEKEWSSEKVINVKLSQKGLLMALDWESTYVKKHTVEGKIDQSIFFAWNYNDSVKGYINEAGNWEVDINEIYYYDNLLITKKNANGEYEETTDMTFGYDEYILYIRCEIPGEYRICAPTEDKDLSDCNYVDIVIEEPSKSVKIYEDAELTKRVIGNSLYYSSTDRTYYFTAEDRNGGQLAFVGYTFPGEDATIKDEGGNPESYYSVDEEKKGVCFSTNENPFSIEIKLKGKTVRDDNKLILVFDYSNGGEDTERFTYEIDLCMSEKGLVMSSDLVLDKDGKYTGEIKNVQSYGREECFSYRYDASFVLALNTKLEAVTSTEQLTRLENAKNLKLEYLTENGYIDATDYAQLTCSDKGIFSLKAKAAGDYRITYTDADSEYNQSSVTISLVAPNAGFVDASAYDASTDTLSLGIDNIYSDSYQITMEDVSAGEKTFYVYRAVYESTEEYTVQNSYNIDVRCSEPGTHFTTQTLISDGGSYWADNIVVAGISPKNILIDSKAATGKYEIYRITVKDGTIAWGESDEVSGECYSVFEFVPLGSYRFDMNYEVQIGYSDGQTDKYGEHCSLSAKGLDIKDAKLDWSLSSECYTGYEVTIDFDNYRYSEMLDVDYYTVSKELDRDGDGYAKTMPGTVYYEIRGWGNFDPDTYISGTFEIKKAPIENIEINSVSAVKNMKAGKPDVAIEAEYYYDTIEQGTHFELAGAVSSKDYSFYNTDKVTPITDESLMKTGEKYYAKIVGIGDCFTGSKMIEFTYGKALITQDSIIGAVDFTKTYTGSAVKADPIVRVDGKILTEGVDYKIVYTVWGEKNETTPVDADHYSYTIVGIGDTESAMSVGGELVIDYLDLSSSKDIKIELKTETGKTAFPTSITYEEALKYNEEGMKLVVTKAGEMLEQGDESDGKDYVCRFDGEVKAGTVNIVVEFHGNYCGRITKTVTVKPAMQFSSSTVSVTVVPYEVGNGFVYSGEPHKPMVKVVKKSNEEVLTYDLDYTLSYSSNINAGTATITVTGVPERGYSGSVKTTFVIEKRPVVKKQVFISTTEVDYNPAGATPTVQVPCGVEGTDYVLKYENNKAVGTGKVTVTFKGNLTGDPVVLEFPIVPARIEYTDNNSVKEYFTETEGDYIKPVTELIYSGVVLKEGTDFTVTYTAKAGGAEVSEGNLLKAGSKANPCQYSVTITGIGNYAGTDEYDISAGCLNRTDISSYAIKLGSTSYTYNSDIRGEIQEELYEGWAYAEKDGERVPGLNLIAVVDAPKAGKGKVYFIPDQSESDDYFGTIAVDITVTPKVLSDSSVEYIAPTGSATPYINKSRKLVTGGIKVRDNGKELVQGKDYTYKFTYNKLEAGENVNAVVTLKGNYKGILTVPVGTICGWNICDDPSVFGYKNTTYTGNEIKFKYTVKAKVMTGNGEIFSTTFKPSDYYVGYYRNGAFTYKIKDVGCYSVYALFAGICNYSEWGVGSFDVTKTPISKAKLTLGTTKYEFNDSIAAEGAKPAVTVKFNNKVVPAEQYEVSYIGNTKPGTGYVVITPTEESNFGGELKGKFEIRGSVDITKAEEININVGDSVCYTPEGAIPEITVWYGGATLVKGEDYKVTAKNNNAVGSASLTITGIGKYKGTTQAYSYSIIPGDFADYDYLALISYGKVKKYDRYGYHTKFMVTTYNGKSQSPDPVLKIGKKTLKNGVDYELTYSNSHVHSSLQTPTWYGTNVVNTGEYKIHITGKGNYMNTIDEDIYLFVLSPSIKNLKYKGATVNYDGEPVTNTISDVKFGNVKLVEGVDYFVSYDYAYTMDWDTAQFSTGEKFYYSYQSDPIDNILPGKKTAYIVGIGNYRSMGIKAVNYTIKGIDINKVKMAKLPEYTYNGSLASLYSDIKLSTTLGGKTYYLTDGIDYEVDYAKISPNAGTKTFIIKGLGMFNGTSRKVTLKIKPKKFAGEILDGGGSPVPYMEYNPDTKAHPIIYLMDYSTGLELTEGKDYVVKKITNNKAVADETSKKAPTMTIVFKGNYTGTATVKFHIEKAYISYYNMLVTDVVSAVDEKGFVKNYKANPVVKSADGKFKLKAGTDYTVKYSYQYNTTVYDAKTKQWVTRNAGDEIQVNDRFKPGVEIRIDVIGKNNFRDSMFTTYLVIKK